MNTENHGNCNIDEMKKFQTNVPGSNYICQFFSLGLNGQAVDRHGRNLRLRRTDSYAAQLESY
jgi:hypothetical protein